MKLRPWVGWAAGLAVVVVAAAVVGSALLRAYEDPDKLWAIVQSCSEVHKHGDVFPIECVSVDPINKIAIVRPIFERWDFLAVPTFRVTGIEDPQVQNPQLPNYWAMAWSAANKYLPPTATQNRANLGLAINSAVSRSENQLHIHISCVKPSVIRALDAAQNEIGPGWSQPFLFLHRQYYRAMRVNGTMLGQANPFLLLSKVPGAPGHMGLHTLVVTGANWNHGTRSGFYILDDFAHDTYLGQDIAHGEDLLDKGCRKFS